MEEKKEEVTKFRPYKRSEKNNSDSSSLEKLEKKDIFLMSFFAFVAAGIVFLLLLLVTGVLTGYVAFDVDLPEFPGEEEVVLEEAPVIPAVEETINETTEVEEEVVVEEVVEEEVEEVLPCGEDITLALNDGYKYGLKVITLKLVSDYSAQISVGGKSEFMDVGNTATINGLEITLIDCSSSDENAVIQVVC